MPKQFVATKRLDYRNQDKEASKVSGNSFSIASTMNHRRNVNNPFANKNRKTVGYSDHRYASSPKAHGRKRHGHRSSLLLILMAAFFLYSLSSLFSSVSVEDYNVSPEPTQKTVKPTGKPTEKPTEQKRDENPSHDSQLDLGGSEEDSGDLDSADLEKILKPDAGDSEDPENSYDSPPNNPNDPPKIPEDPHHSYDDPHDGQDDPHDSQDDPHDGQDDSQDDPHDSQDDPHDSQDDLRNAPEFDLLSPNGDIVVPEFPKNNDSLKETPAEDKNSNVTILNVTASSVDDTNSTAGSDTNDTTAVNKTATNTSSATDENENVDSSVVETPVEDNNSNVTILNVTASSVDDTNSTAGSDTNDTTAVNKTATNTSSATDENENVDSSVVEMKEDAKASPNSTDVENTTANATIGGTIPEIMDKLGASVNATDGVITSGNQTGIESSLDATGADEKVSVDTAAAATSPNATEVGKNETSSVNDADVIPIAVTNETDTGADATNSTNNTTIESDERGNLRGSTT